MRNHFDEFQKIEEQMFEIERRLQKQEENTYKNSNARSSRRLCALSAGFFFGCLAIMLAYPNIYGRFVPFQQRDVSAFLAGMFGFASIEAFRNSY